MISRTINTIRDFIGLLDTPSGYAGHAGKTVRVSAAEDGLEFASGYVIDGASFLDSLSDFDRDIDGGAFI